jgi:cellobiose-specific phosphotransferase system component IIA
MILCIVGYSNEGHIQLNVESAHAQGSLMDAETIKKVLEFNRENENLINKAISYLRDSKVNAALQTFKEAIHVAHIVYSDEE